MKRIKQISRHNFCSCEKKPKTIEACVGFKNLTSAIPVQCPTIDLHVISQLEAGHWVGQLWAHERMMMKYPT